MMSIGASETSKAARSRRNRDHYRKLKATREPILLRLAEGDRCAFDSAAKAAGLSRAAFSELYLVAICRALSAERIAKLSSLSSAQGVGLATALGRLIDHATLAPAQAPSPEVGSEFDDLFDSEP